VAGVARGREPVATLLAALDRAYARQSWHGTNLRGSIRGLTAAEAARRPAPGRHNIWELVVHAAYWKYAVWRRLTGARRGSFPLKGSNWFKRPLPGRHHDKAWREDLALLDMTHRELRRAIAGLPPSRPGGGASGRGTSARHLILGIVAHDLYHAGQIQLIKRLIRR
jgi:hypothetical protein